MVLIIEKILDELKQELESSKTELRIQTDDSEMPEKLEGEIYAYENAIEIVKKYLKK